MERPESAETRRRGEEDSLTVKWEMTGKILAKCWMRMLERETSSTQLPNFFMTEEYINKKGLLWIERDDMVGYVEEGSDDWFFPPLHKEEGLREDQPYYCGFLGEHVSFPGFELVELDRQYLYDPAYFLCLNGSEWRTFRKNIRKWQSRTEEILYYPLGPGDRQDQVEDLLVTWAEGREIQDPETMVRFVTEGELRWGLFWKDRLIGLNVADENWRHIVFRYCLDNGEPFLNEFMRYQFYTSYWVRNSSMQYVNDGGDLGRKGLRRFKERLNPARIMTVYSNQREQQ